MTNWVVLTEWNRDERALDLMLPEAGWDELGLYEIFGNNKEMMMALLGCGECSDRNEALERMPESQVTTPWFVGRMTNDPVLIRCKCELLRQWVELRKKKGTKPPCLRLI